MRTIITFILTTSLVLNPRILRNKFGCKKLVNVNVKPNSLLGGKTINRKELDEFSRTQIMTRKEILTSSRLITMTSLVAELIGNTPNSHAAPPFAVISEELGYFPVTNSVGETVFVPANIKRSSSNQAIDLAGFLKSSGAVMYGTFWCPHCRRQKEIFGKEAWAKIPYVECASNGYKANQKLCTANDITGFPTWKFKNGKEASGEMSLQQLAEIAGYKGTLQDSLEIEPPELAGSCR